MCNVFERGCSEFSGAQGSEESHGAPHKRMGQSQTPEGGSKRTERENVTGHLPTKFLSEQRPIAVAIARVSVALQFCRYRRQSRYTPSIPLNGPIASYVWLFI